MLSFDETDRSSWSWTGLCLDNCSWNTFLADPVSVRTLRANTGENPPRDGRNGHPRWWHLEDPGAATKGSKFLVGSTIEGYGKCQPQWLWEFLRKPLQWKRLDCNPCIVQSCCERSGWESTLGPQIRSRDARQTSINIMSTPQGCWGRQKRYVKPSAFAARLPIKSSMSGVWRPQR